MSPHVFRHIAGCSLLRAKVKKNNGNDGLRIVKKSEVSLTGLADDGRLNRFNGIGVGVYATSDGRKSRNEASFSHFVYEDIASPEASPRQ
ncbi:MAG: hypothetical protein K2L56_09400 [Prevotella sp.]|nr:hypothetical protein [Prevotella sp.]